MTTKTAMTTIETALRNALPRGAYLHSHGDSFACEESFPGGKLLATVHRTTGAWSLVARTWNVGKPGSVDSGIASGPDFDAARFAETFAAHLDVLTNGTPKVGEGATFTVATDHHACTVERVDLRADGTPWRVVLRRDHAKLLNGAGSGEPDALHFSPGGFCGHTSGTQRYAYEANTNGETYVVTRRMVRGRVRWVQVGQDSKSPGLCAHFRGRSEHYDFNF